MKTRLQKTWILFLALGGLALPIRSEGQTTPTYYVALGDSLAQGEQPVPGGGKEVYHGYAEKLAPQVGLTLKNLACGGETTATMVSGGSCTYSEGSQLAAAEAFITSHTVQLVTIDIGADDYSSCATGSGYDVGCLTTKTTEVVINLGKILTRLRHAGGPMLRIVAMNYYDPYLVAWFTPVTGPAESAATLLAITTFNAAETAEYVLFGVPVADVANAFQSINVLPQFFDGQLVPTNVVKICEFTWMRPQDGSGIAGNIHANDQGYQLIADTLYPLTR